MSWSWAPVIMIGGFLCFGALFVTVSDIGDWLSRRGRQ
jgi:hypothetical protein